MLDKIKYLVSIIGTKNSETKESNGNTITLNLVFKNSKGFKNKEDAINFSEELKSQGIENLIIDIDELVGKRTESMANEIIKNAVK